ncbi:MAG: DUF559 domain-containing protein [Bacteroidales bacterium]
MKRRKIIPYNPRLKRFARDLRNNCTRSEALLWKYLKGKQMKGYDFHRQKPLGNFIADFFCHELRLVIELDGLSHLHEDVIARDKIKEQKLNEMGLTVLRFKDAEVFRDTENILRKIEAYISEFEQKRAGEEDQGQAG